MEILVRYTIQNSCLKKRLKLRRLKKKCEKRIVCPVMTLSMCYCDRKYKK
jgi:hypothetical protein